MPNPLFSFRNRLAVGRKSLTHVTQPISAGVPPARWNNHPRAALRLNSIAFLNRENTKKLEIHEIFASRILVELQKNPFYGAIPCAFCFFRGFHFPFAFSRFNARRKSFSSFFIARNISYQNSFAPLGLKKDSSSIG